MVGEATALTGESELLTLADLVLQESATITAVSVGSGVVNQTALRRLAEIGFLPGERVKVVARVPGGDPMAVRVGNSTFALRRREAQCVHVRVRQPNE